MHKTETLSRKALAYIIISFSMIWLGFGASFCYEMGKNGIDAINWMTIIKANIPVVIISLSLLISAFSEK